MSKKTVTLPIGSDGVVETYVTDEHNCWYRQTANHMYPAALDQFRFLDRIAELEAERTEILKRAERTAGHLENDRYADRIRHALAELAPLVEQYIDEYDGGKE